MRCNPDNRAHSPGVSLFAASLALIAPSAARCGGLKTDAQLWQELDLAAPLGASATATVIGLAREGEGLPNPSLYGGGATFDLRAGAWTLTGGDLWVTARNATSGANAGINVPLAAVAYTWSFAGVSMSDRNRFEQLMGAPGDPWRYRNRLSWSYPVQGFGPVSSLFASDEVFYDLGRDRWSRNRAQAGLELTLSPSVAAQIYYMRQDDIFSRPSTLDIAGTALRFELR